MGSKGKNERELWPSRKLGSAIPAPLEWWPTRQLKLHPIQVQVFNDRTEREHNALVEEMKRHGQRSPVEILPSGIIIAGHEWFFAARRLKRNQLEVIVRRDLAKAGDKVVQEMLAVQNPNHKLTPLAVVRRMYEIFEKEDGPAGLRPSKLEQLRCLLVEMLHRTRRTVNRYLLVLNAPACIQAALEKEQISLIEAGKIAAVTKQQQEEVTYRIAKGEEPNSVVKDILASTGRAQSGDMSAALRRRARSFGHEVLQFKGKIASLPPEQLAKVRKTMEETQGLLAELLRAGSRLQRPRL